MDKEPLPIEQLLRHQLYRHDCPSPQTLGDYHLDLLDGDASHDVADHLELCPHCQRELLQLSQFLADLEPDSPGLLSRIQVWIAERLPRLDGLASPVAPAFALRGDQAEASELHVYAAGDAQVTVELTSDPLQPGHNRLLGLVIGIDTGGMSAQLWRARERLLMTAVDDFGSFSLGPVAAGQYELILSGPEIEIYIQELSV